MLSERLLGYKEWLYTKRSEIEQLVILFSTALLLAVFMSSILSRSITIEHLRQGEVALHTVRSQVEFKIEDSKISGRASMITCPNCMRRIIVGFGNEKYYEEIENNACN